MAVARALALRPHFDISMRVRQRSIKRKCPEMNSALLSPTCSFGLLLLRLSVGFSKAHTARRGPDLQFALFAIFAGAFLGSRHAIGRNN